MDDVFLPTPSSWATQNTSTTSTTTNCDVIDASTGNMFYSMFMLILLLFSIFGNSIVVLAVVLSNKLTDRSTFYFVASLACSDMVMAVFQIPIRISVKLHNMSFCFGLPACYLRIIMDVFGNIASILNLFLISMDRFIAIELPYRYVVLLSHARAKLLMLVIWIFAAMWGFSGIFRWKDVSKKGILSIYINTGTGNSTGNNMCVNENDTYFFASFYGMYFPILIIMTCVYIRILQVALVQIRRIQTSKPKPIYETKKNNSKNKNRLSAHIRKGSLHKEMKATKSVAIVYLAFCLCWLPSAIFVLISYFNKEYFAKLDRETTYAIWFTFVDIFPMVNTMINPIIYSFSNTQFRNAVQDVWRKFMGKAAKRDFFESMADRNSSYGRPSPLMRDYADNINDTSNGATERFL